MSYENVVQWILGVILVLSSLGVILSKNPVHSSLSFLLTLISLAAFYLQLSAEFIAVMQVLVYAGAILVIFIFVIVLFQDAHQQIEQFQAKSSRILLIGAASALLLSFILLGFYLSHLAPISNQLPQGYGTVESLGTTLYLDFFFPFEAVIMLFLIAVIGAFYIGKKVSHK